MSPRTAPRRVAIIGLGAIGRIVLDGIENGPATVTAVVVRSSHVESAQALVPNGVSVVTGLDELDAGAVDLLLECAGHEAVTEFAEPALRLGADLMVIATGALADDALRARLSAAAQKSGARILLPAGAIAGLDGLSALRRGGLDSVRYVASKPPDAWIGTPAEETLELGAVNSATTFFTGSAGEAARRYPKNANLAATVALAGLGFDETVVELVADPTTADNVGRIEAEGKLGRLELELRGPPMSENPKTSVITAFSILEAIERAHRTIVV